MAKDESLQHLLDQWESAQAAGQSMSAEELCRGRPDLLEAAKRQIQAMQAMGRLLGSGKDACCSTGPPGIVGTPDTSTNDGFLKAGVEPVPGYRLVNRLGRGGFGEVWKATGPGGFAVALKFVRLAEKAGRVELHALEVVKDIRHPNLLATFGAWQQHGYLIVAMELADRTLLDRFQEATSQNLPGIPGPELLEYFTEAAKGIDFLNETRHRLDGQESAGIQHRDIKPQNLLLVGGSVMVADFGLARSLTHTITGHTGSMTPAYAAPEFFDGKTHRHSDQYSLAITYCFLRGGRLPFEGDAAQVMAGHLRRAPDLTMVPEEERSVVARALAKDPARRWPSCAAFVTALRECQIPRPPRATSRRRVLLGVGVLSLVVCAVILGVHGRPLDKTSQSEKPEDAKEQEQTTNDVAKVAPVPPTKPSAGVAKPATAPTDEDGFVRLDNGKDLSGWTGTKKGWSVRNGAIHLDGAAAPVNATLYSEHVPSNHCVVRLQFRAMSDAGVLCLSIHDTPFILGQSPGTGGPKKYQRVAKPPREWNDLEFQLSKKIALIRLNGEVIEREWPVHAATKSVTGIGLRRYTGSFEYRNIRVKEKGADRGE